MAFLDRVRVRNWWTKEVPGALFAEVPTAWFPGVSGNRSGSRIGSVDAERNIQNEKAPEGRALPSELSGWGFTKKRSVQGGSDCLGALGLRSRGGNREGRTGGAGLGRAY